MDIVLDVPVDEVESLRRERAAGREDVPQLCQAVGLARTQIALGQAIEESGGDAEVGDPFGVGVIEQDAPRPEGRRAVIEQQRGPAGQAGNQPVPHHPAASGEVEETIPGPDIAMQLVLLEVLQKGPASAMNQALRLAGCPGGKQDIEGMIEGQPREADRGLTRVGRHEVIQHDGVRNHAQVRTRVHVAGDQ